MNAWASADRFLERLMNAADRACMALGEAQWTNGYRACMGKHHVSDEEGW